MGNILTASPISPPNSTVKQPAFAESSSDSNNNGLVVGVIVMDPNNAEVPSTIAADGTDGAGTGANGWVPGVQTNGATPGKGIRGWLSTLVGIFQTGNGKIAVTQATAANLLAQVSQPTAANLQATVTPAASTAFATVAQDGTDPVGTNAGTQAGSTTVGVGIRGWLSTLVGLFQLGLATVRRPGLYLYQTNAAVNANGNSGTLTTGGYTEMAIDITVGAMTGGTAPTIQYTLNRLDAFGNATQLWQSSAIGNTGGTASASVGLGAPTATNASLGQRCQLNWTVTGSPTTVPHQVSLASK